MSQFWPSTLPPRPLVEGYQERAPSVVVRTEMESGPAKMRRRFTAGVREVQASVMLRSREQLDDLDEFFTDTLAGGALSFEWQDRNGTTKEFRFIEPPTYEPEAPEVWRARMRLEILP